jgi:hypothetical protein
LSGAERISESMRSGVRALLAQLLKQYEEAESECQSWFAWSEERTRKPGAPAKHVFTAADLIALEHHATAIYDMQFWPRVAKLQSDYRNDPQWAQMAMFLLKYLPDDAYRETAAELLPLLPKLRQRISRVRNTELTAAYEKRNFQAWPLALWHAQFHIGAADITPQNWYPPASLATTTGLPSPGKLMPARTRIRGEKKQKT